MENTKEIKEIKPFNRKDYFEALQEVIRKKLPQDQQLAEMLKITNEFQVIKKRN